MFENISNSFNNLFNQLKSRGLLTEKQISETLENLRISLIESDVNIEVINQFIEDVKQKALSSEISKQLNPAQQVAKIVYDELNIILGSQLERKLNFSKNPPTVFLLVGLQGSGKTTFAAKFAKYLQKQKNTPLLVAADLQRPNAVTQLTILANENKIPIFAPHPGVQSGDNQEQKGLIGKIFEKKGNPVDVVKKGLEYAKENYYNCVIIDTAGRVSVDQELMKEVEDISKVANPDETFFVIDSMTGQVAADVAQSFNQYVEITGTVLTKLDSDTRGGAALSVTQVTGKPIIFASTGEKIDNLELFHPDRMASRILELGDIQTLLEQAEEKMDQEKAEELGKKVLSGKKFDFNDFLEQLEQVKKMGDLKSMIKMIPGMAKYQQAIEQFDEKELDKQKAIVLSMTKQERENPEILEASRKERIAYGSGNTMNEINTLLEKFEQMNQMTQKMVNPKKGKLPKGLPPELASQFRAKDEVKEKTNKKKKKFGNPAKQAQWEKEHPEG